MTTAAQSRYALRLVKRYPLLGGLALSALGGAMVHDAVADAATYGPHVQGAEVEAQIIAVRPTGGLFPRYEMELQWTDPGGVSRRGVTRIYRAQARRLAPGDSVPAVLAKGDASRVVLHEILGNKSLFRVGSTWLSPLALVGGLLSFVGLLVATLRHRLVGHPD